MKKPKKLLTHATAQLNVPSGLSGHERDIALNLKYWYDQGESALMLDSIIYSALILGPDGREIEPSKQLAAFYGQVEEHARAGERDPRRTRFREAELIELCFSNCPLESIDDELRLVRWDLLLEQRTAELHRRALRYYTNRRHFKEINDEEYEFRKAIIEGVVKDGVRVYPALTRGFLIPRPADDITPRNLYPPWERGLVDAIDYRFEVEVLSAVGMMTNNRGKRGISRETMIPIVKDYAEWLMTRMAKFTGFDAQPLPKPSDAHDDFFLGVRADRVVPKNTFCVVLTKLYDTPLIPLVGPINYGQVIPDRAMIKVWLDQFGDGITGHTHYKELERLLPPPTEK